MPGSWEEAKHPRAGDGKFGAGSGGSSSGTRSGSAAKIAAAGKKRLSKAEQRRAEKAKIDAMLAPRGPAASPKPTSEGPPAKKAAMSKPDKPAPATREPPSSAPKPAPTTTHAAPQPPIPTAQQYEAAVAATVAMSSDAEMRAQTSYTTAGHRPVNAFLRGIPMDPRDKKHALPQEEIDETVRSLDALLSRNKLRSPITTLRGAEDHPSFANLQPGDMFVEKGYMSTTVNPNIANSRSDSFGQKAGYLFKITCPVGTKAAAVHSEFGGSYRHSEAEVLLGRGTALRLESRTMDKDPAGRDRHVLHFTVVGQE